MMTILTEVRLKRGTEGDWDAAMRERMAAARKQPGWIAGQMLKPIDEPDKRVIVGTWRTRDDWKRWHEDPRFAETRREVNGLVAEPEAHAWHDVVIEAREDGARRNATRRGAAKARGRGAAPRQERGRPSREQPARSSGERADRSGRAKTARAQTGRGSRRRAR